MSIHSIIENEWLSSNNNSNIEISHLSYILIQNMPKDFLLSYARDYIYFNEKYMFNNKTFWKLYNDVYTNISMGRK